MNPVFLRNKKSSKNRLSCFSETHNLAQPVPYSLRDCDNDAERDDGTTANRTTGSCGVWLYGPSKLMPNHTGNLPEIQPNKG